MNLLQAFLLGVLQGATEFLPVSSSGHLVLVPWLLGWPAPGLAFDTIVHWGTAMAVILYFWRDWLAIVQAALSFPINFARNPQSAIHNPQSTCLPARQAGRRRQAIRLLWFIILGTLPAVVFGLLLEDFFEGIFGRPAAVACFLLVTAAILTISERLGRRERDVEAMNWLDALLIGLAQAVAILPGVSRSGSTIAGGLARGLKRDAAARFSFLLATPIILGAGVLQLKDLAQAGNLAAQLPMLGVGFAAAGAVGLGCIHFLMRYLQRRRLYPFAIYCAVAGVACLLVAMVRG